MAWLHTWAGLVFGWLLFAIFLTGTLSYFKEEITQWTQPEIVPHEVSDAVAAERGQQWLQANAPDAKRWFIRLPDERNPDIALTYSPANGGFERKSLDSVSGQPVQGRESMGGEFFYRFHFQLQMPHPWGRWLASVAAMVMFVALISGIITHKKIFKEFFTFRPRKGQRTWLDGHNAVAVLILPFHLMITYSSLVIFMTMVMPASILTTYGSNTSAFFDDLFPAFKSAPPVSETAPLASIVPMLEVAAQKWDGARVGLITVNNPGKANATVALGSNGADHIPHEPGTSLVFNGVTGELTQQSSMTAASLLLAGGMYGLHMGHFAGTLLRWLYFFAGIGGTAMIATGLVIWLGKRRLKHAKSGVLPFELKLVEMLNVASMSGLMLAVVSFFWANRMLPVSLAARSDWEVKTFFCIWGLALLHAFGRVFFRDGRTAWREQLILAAALYCLLPVLDMLTAGSYLWGSIRQGQWTLAALDLTALATGIFLAWGAFRFRGEGQSVIASKLTPTGSSRKQDSRQTLTGGSELAREGVSEGTTVQEAR